MLHKGFIVVAVLGCICLALNILNIMAVPITKPERGLYLSSYENYTYGIFGLCYNDYCTEPRIGYPSNTSAYFMEIHNLELPSGDLDMRLPSRATYRVSKLLVVHLVSTCLTFILVLFAISINIYLYANEKETKSGSRNEEELLEEGVVEEIQVEERDERDERDERERDGDEIDGVEGSEIEGNGIEGNNIEERGEVAEEHHVDPEEIPSRRALLRELIEDNHSHLLTHSDLHHTTYYKKDITGFLNIMLILTLFSFLFSLLAFLADILLFVPQLSYLGWIQIIPIVFFAIVLSMLCLMKRFTVTMRYLDEIPKYGNDDMRSRKFFNPHKWSEMGSDDGFIAYANGIYSNFNDNENNDYNEGRVRHNYHRLDANEDDSEHVYMYSQAGSEHSIASTTTNEISIELSTFSSSVNE